MNTPEASIRVNVDPRNPGQFFACCGLLELADRLWCGAEGWFEAGQFHIATHGNLKELLASVVLAELTQLDPEDDFSSAMELGSPISLRLDWWLDERAGGKPLKVWAGSMRSVRIARAMRQALTQPEFANEDLLDRAQVVRDPLEPDKKVEPYYFDSRRGANAQSLDVGFGPDSLGMETVAYPAAEFLCLVGLQRGRPATTPTPRVFNYFTWPVPLPISLILPGAAGLLHLRGGVGYRFENAFRTNQRKHKSFLPATPLGGS